MPEIKESRELPFNASQIYDLVADVASYPDFLPWTQQARIRNLKQEGFEADLVLGFQFIRETFTSKVTLYPSEYRVHAQGIGSGPFKVLINDWRIFPITTTCCRVDFGVKFEIRNFALRRLLEPLYAQAQRQIISAFESRARTLYLK